MIRQRVRFAIVVCLALLVASCDPGVISDSGNGNRGVNDGGGLTVTGADGLARDLESLGLWRGLPDDVRESNVADVAAGVHPWATIIADDVAFFADGEDLAEGGVVQFLAELSEPLAALGVVLDAETIGDRSTASYVVSINGTQIDLYDEASWDSSSETENPWFTSTVRPLAVVNGLLRDVGAVERLFVLYPGTNYGIALLIDPEIVTRIIAAGLDDENELPIEPNK